MPQKAQTSQSSQVQDTGADHHYPFQGFFARNNLLSVPNRASSYINTRCLSQYYDYLNVQLAAWDTQLASFISKSKKEYILDKAELPMRSVCMAVSCSLMYRVISWRTIGFLPNIRNLAISFAFMSYAFVPELINPYLKSKDLLPTEVQATSIFEDFYQKSKFKQWMGQNRKN